MSPRGPLAVPQGAHEALGRGVVRLCPVQRCPKFTIIKFVFHAHTKLVDMLVVNGSRTKRVMK